MAPWVRRVSGGGNARLVGTPVGTSDESLALPPALRERQSRAPPPRRPRSGFWRASGRPPACSSQPPQVVACDCGERFGLSARNIREHRRQGTTPRCRRCRYGSDRTPKPTDAMRRWWLARYSLDRSASSPPGCGQRMRGRPKAPLCHVADVVPTRAEESTRVVAPSANRAGEQERRR